MKKLRVYLTKFDHYLTDFNHKIIAVYLLSLASYFVLIRSENSSLVYDVPISAFLGFYFIWFYLSSRKYGFVETTMFCIFIPFYVISALIPLLSPDKKKVVNLKKDYSGLADTLSDTLESTINEIYAGKAIEKRSETDGVFVLFEAPYGINIPEKEIISQIAPSLHISESNITYSEITSRKTQFIITPKGLIEYDEYKRLCMPWDNFYDIKERILLRMKALPVIQKSHSVSV